MEEYFSLVSMLGCSVFNKYANKISNDHEAKTDGT